MEVKRTTLRDNTLQKKLTAETRTPMGETEKVNKPDTVESNNSTVDETNIIKQEDEESEQENDTDKEPEVEKDNTNEQESDTDKELEEEKVERDTQTNDMDKKLGDEEVVRNKAESQKDEVIDRKETVQITKPEEQRSETIEAAPTTTPMLKKKPSIFSRKKSTKEDIYKTTAQKIKEGLSTREQEPPRTQKGGYKPTYSEDRPTRTAQRPK